MIMNNKSKGGSNGSSNNAAAKALTVIMPNNSSNPKPIAPKVPGSNNGNKANKNSAAPARLVHIGSCCLKLLDFTTREFVLFVQEN